MPRLSRTFRSLGNIPLDNDTSFSFPLYKGFELRPIIITQMAARFERFDRLANQQRQVRLHIRAFGKSVNIPVTIVRIEAGEAGRINIVMFDRRAALSRIYTPMNFNTRLQEELENDQIVEEIMGVKRSRAYLDGTSQPGTTVDALPHTVFTAIEMLRRVTRQAFSGSAVIPMGWRPGARAIAREWRVPDNVNIAGASVLDAMQRLLEPAALSITADVKGKIWIVDAESDNVNARLTSTRYAWEKPPFKRKIGGGYLKPARFIVPYFRREEHELRGDIGANENEHTLSMRNVYRGNRGQWVNLTSFIQSFHPSLTGTELTDEIIANNWFGENWTGTLLQQDSNGVKVIPAIPETTRLTIAHIMLPEILARWRRTFQIRSVRPGGEGAPAEDLDSIRGQGDWADIKFGAIPTLSLTPTIEDNTVRNPLKEDQNVFAGDYESNYSVLATWVDKLVKAEQDLSRVGPDDPFIKGLRTHRDNGSGPAPFTPVWVEQDVLVFDVVPIPTETVSARIPGFMDQKDVILLPGDFKPLGIPTNRILGGAILADARNAPRVIAPTLNKNYLLRVYVNGTRRAPQNRDQFHEETVTAFEDGSGDWYLPAAGGRFAFFSSNDKEKALNFESLKLDAESRARAVIARIGYNIGGIGSIGGVEGSDIVVEGPHIQTDIVSGSYGKYTVFTRITMGQSSVTRPSPASMGSPADLLPTSGGDWSVDANWRA